MTSSCCGIYSGWTLHVSMHCHQEIPSKRGRALIKPIALSQFTDVCRFTTFRLAMSNCVSLNKLSRRHLFSESCKMLFVPLQGEALQWLSLVNQFFFLIVWSTSEDNIKRVFTSKSHFHSKTSPLNICCIINGKREYILYLILF